MYEDTQRDIDLLVTEHYDSRSPSGKRYKLNDNEIELDMLLCSWRQVFKAGEPMNVSNEVQQFRSEVRPSPESQNVRPEVLDRKYLQRTRR